LEVKWSEHIKDNEQTETKIRCTIENRVICTLENATKDVVNNKIKEIKGEF
jgi:hypothetical protein